MTITGGNTLHENRPEHARGGAGLHVLVHSGLRAHFDLPHPAFSLLRSRLDGVEFVDPDDLTAFGGTLDLPALIPVSSEFQAEELRALRVRYPLSLLIGVTRCVLGQRTYLAIRSGANSVLNLAIPGRDQIDVLCAQLRAHTTATACHAAARLRGVPGAPDGGGTDEDRWAREGHPLREEEAPPRGVAYSTLAEGDRKLLRLLCTSMTVNEIARRHYCSERSMYRRIRKLYDGLGVCGRTELLSKASALGLNRPMTVHAC
ncbi:helix-turn-helix transcriptional regulator [Streptomyces sp. NPDC002454]